MFTLKSETEFDAAHFLSGYEGKCANIHGHRYRLAIKVSGAELEASGQSRGMIVDFSVIKDKLRAIHDLYDHKLIIEENEEGQELAGSLKDKYSCLLVPYRPTAEEMSRDIYRRLKGMGLNITEVELYETGVSSCVYTEDD